MAWYHVMPGWRLAALPLFTLLGLGAALGVSLWLAALSAKYRDFIHLLQFVMDEVENFPRGEGLPQLA